MVASAAALVRHFPGQGMTCSPKARSSIQNSTSMSELPKISQPSLRLFQVPATHFSPLELAPVNSPWSTDTPSTLVTNVVLVVPGYLNSHCMQAHLPPGNGVFES